MSLLSDRLSAHAYKRENGVTNGELLSGQLQPPGEDLEVV